MSHALDSYGGVTDLKGERTGWFHLERIGERDWFVTPEGHAFFPLSLAHLFTCDSRPTIDRFYGGSQETWMRDWLGQCRALGFNCSLSGATSNCRNRIRFVDVPLAETLFHEVNFPFAAGIFLIPHPHELPEGQERADVFDPAYAAWAEEQVEAACARYAGDPLLLGYYFGFGPLIRVDLWIASLLSREPGAPGREALVDALRARYADDAEEFNRVHGTALKRIDDLRTHAVLELEPVQQREFSPKGDTLARRRREDVDALARLLANQAYAAAFQALRRRDPRHLIFGPYVKETSFSFETWSDLAPGLDLLAPQHSHRAIDFAELRRRTGRPILVSDETTGHYTEHRAHGVKSWEHKGALYRLALERHLRDPNVSGVCFCSTFWDLDEGPMRMRGALEGLYDQQGRPRPALLDAIAQSNAGLYSRALHPLDAAEIDRMAGEFFAAWDRSMLAVATKE